MNFFSSTVVSAAAWSPALIAKYNVAGPRYTSYPTAPLFTENFTAQDYMAEALSNRDTNIAPLSLYLHIPFCRNICYYCACNKVITKDSEAARIYLDHLHREMDMQAGLFSKRRPVMQLHLGGGTPTFLAHAELTELMHMLATHFRMVDNRAREYSIEIDPRTITSETLALLKGLGFNRLSFGIQDFDEQVQRAVNRIQSYESVRHLTEAARHFGFKSLSYDLIYGLPFQSPESLQRTLDRVISLSPDRIACYNYAHLPERFPNQRAIDRLTLPSAEQKLEMLSLISRRLLEAGYLFIGMDHFVKPGDDLAAAQRCGKLQRNFQGYSTCLAPDVVGMGMSAISSLENCYAQNEKELNSYYRRIDAGELPIQRGYRLDRDDQIRRRLIMALICNLEVDTQDLEQRFDISFDDYFAREKMAVKPMIDDGLVEWQGKTIRVTAPGRPLLRNICMVFDKYLQQETQIRYSKVL